MTKGIYTLFADNKPLPPGTLIRETAGGVNTGQWHPLPEHMLKLANRTSLTNPAPYWVTGWRDLAKHFALPEDLVATGRSLHSTTATPRNAEIAKQPANAGQMLGRKLTLKTCNAQRNET